MSNPYQSKISIIVPVYNVEKYLSKCIESILAQTYTDFELLLIDDGSPDRSGAICDEYAAHDPRIRVFHKPNGGVSSARNLGLDNARGEWITFIDADDWIESNTLSICSKYWESYDIVRFSFRYISRVGDRISTYVRSIPDNDNKIQYLYRIVSRNSILGVCGGVYRNSLFKDSCIRFSTDLSCGEDWLVHFLLVLNSKEIKEINVPLYNYNHLNVSSCTNTDSLSNHLSILKAFTRIKKAIEVYLEDEPNNQYVNFLNKGKFAAKCNLVYDFIFYAKTQKCIPPISLCIEYQRNCNLAFKEILTGSKNPKQFMVLAAFKCIVEVRSLIDRILKLYKH